MFAINQNVVIDNAFVFQKNTDNNYFFINLKIPNLDVLLVGFKNWNTWNDVDVFSYIDNCTLDRLRNDPNFYIFIDMAEEGFDPVYQFKFWPSISSSIVKNNIPAKKIFYFSCNLQDENNSKHVAFNVHVEHMWWSWQNDLHDYFSVDKEFKRAVKNTIRLHDSKFYSSLNRAPRFYRTYLNASLYYSSAGAKGLFSQMPIPEDNFKYNREDINWKMLEQFQTQLPLYIDYKVMNEPVHAYKHIFDETIFHIANETVISKKYDRHMITEKTFKAISTFTPMILFASGSPNQDITNYGFKTYQSYFDVKKFDTHVPVDKINAIVKETKRVCKKLSQMSKTQRVDWKFQDEDLLKHNFAVFRANTFNKTQRKKLLDRF